MKKRNRYHSIIKRGIDLAVATFGLILCAPTMIFIAILVKLDSPGPIIFAHKRIGKDGKGFKMFKFRSMVHDAEEILKRDSELKRAYENDYKIKSDPRITKIGKFIRNHSLDELPQIINVLRGEMSLVGPRPVIEDELRKYGPLAEKLLVVKPGITGLWQISGRSNISYEERVKIDTDYIENYSILMDLKILFKTIPVVIFGSGAY